MKKALTVMLAASIIITLACCSGKIEQNSDFQSTQSSVEQSSSVKRETDYLVLVNRISKLPDDYESTIELIEGKNSFGETFKIEKQTYEHFKKLRERMLMQDIQIEVNRAYITADEQNQLIEKYTTEYNADYAYNYEGEPYYSENQTGLSIDLALYFAGERIDNNEELLKMSGIFREIHVELANYGFILRYPEEKVKETDFMYQPWHIRYVGEDNAKAIYEQELTLEEYLS